MDKHRARAEPGRLRHLGGSIVTQDKRHRCVLLESRGLGRREEATLGKHGVPEESRECAICFWGKNKVWGGMNRTEIEIRSHKSKRGYWPTKGLCAQSREDTPHLPV